MSMMANYYRTTPQELRRLHDDASAANAYFGYDFNPDDDDAMDAFLDRREESGKFLEIYRAWHGLNFLLTGDADIGGKNSPPPLGNVVMCDTPTEWETSYGQIRELTPLEVKQVSQTLQSINRGDLEAKLDVTAFNAHSIYPGENEWDQESLDELLEAFDEVVIFFQTAAETGESVLLELS